MQWIKNQAMEYMSGKMVGFIREILTMTIEMATGSFSIMEKPYIKAIGRMGKKLIQIE